MHHDRTRKVLAAIAAAFFATPLALLVVGVRAGEFENRQLASAPSLESGWDVFDETTRWLTDHMPLREEAVRANTRISLDVFDTTPLYGQIAHETTSIPAGEPAGQEPAPPPATASQVLRGEDGWLYLQGEIDRACGPFVPFAEALARWRRLVDIVRVSGRRAVLLVPPDKTAIYPEHLPGDLPTRGCLDAANAQLWDLLEPPRGGVVGLREPVARLKAETDELVYKRKDSHWNDIAALETVRHALAGIGAPVSVRPEEIVDPGPAAYNGDLTVLLGVPESDEAPRRKIARRPGAPRMLGTTLFVYDSYGDAVLPLLRPYFTRLETFLWDASTAEQLAAAIKSADRVIFESVEREFTYRTSDAGYVHPRLFDVLRAELR